ncbi:hypothetical protein HPB50_018532 [Hyalomma asiaticum]|uniref:Uncharacterized protein n=1 Tax=Hyalomma asiaticum TaxID=266040 RepID=A0ACB7TPU3_HYAAI|nr:hypothetical protein HPB50_018532 [Hyalomma asiaticum]
MGARYVKKVVKSDASPITRGQDIVKKKKKKKKGKLPKNYDPNVDPDPERWLPRRERSTFKKRKDRRGASSAIVRSLSSFVSQEQRNVVKAVQHLHTTAATTYLSNSRKYWNEVIMKYMHQVVRVEATDHKCVAEDVYNTELWKRRQSVLIFPVLPKRERWLTHKAIEEKFEDLCSFSLGEGVYRRTAVCLKSRLIL